MPPPPPPHTHTEKHTESTVNRSLFSCDTIVLLSVLRSLCDSDNDFDDDDDDVGPSRNQRSASVGTQWRDFFHVEEYD